MSSLIRDSSYGGPVMVVVDDPTTSDGLVQVLGNEGFQVLLAAGESDAIALAGEHRPRVLIVDSELGGGGGTELARRLKTREPTAAVLLLTGPAGLDAALRVASELDGLLVKPLIRETFLQSVRNAFAVGSMADEIRRLSSDVAKLSADGGPVLADPAILDRSQFSRRLEAALAESHEQDIPMAVVVAELGGWPEPSDQADEPPSEETIALLTRRLAGSRRKTDLVGRIAFDRFAIACTNIGSSADCHRVVRIVLEALEGPLDLGGREHWLAPRAGVVLTDPTLPEQGAESVLTDAETALDFARDESRPWKLFDKSLLDEVFVRQQVSVAVLQAIESGELAIVYQPVVELESGKIVGAATRIRLLRSDDPTLISTEVLAQQGDPALTTKVASWMLERSFADLASWRESQQLQDDFRLGIGVSSRDVTDPQFAEMVEEQVERHSIPPSMVNLDLSGPAITRVTSPDFSLTHLYDMGFRFNLDDFGTAEFALTSLTHLPVNALKIDSSLTESLDAQDASYNTALVRGLISLGHEMRMTVIGKGVTTEAQRTALLAMGCKLGQYARYGHPGEPGQPWQPSI